LDNLNALAQDMQERDDNIYRVIFEAEPIPSSVRKAGYGGVDRYDRLKGYQKSEVVINTTQKLDQLASQLYVQSKSFDEVFEMAKNKSEMLASIPAIQPIKNYDLRRISSYYGIRMDPFYKVNKFHSGIDFSALSGTEVFVTGNGKVVRLERSRWGYGNTITIDHGFGYQTKYAHLNEFKVRKGEKVTRGQLIGTVGNSGKSTAPHLHYEVIKNNRPVNPIHFFFNDLTPEEYETILELSQLPMQSMD
jgi:murein DD-endopeptidase MepM/ murein hydrolase activator NlpD